MPDTTYLSEVEDRFRYARDSEGCVFSLSPKDWVLADSWRTAGIPLQAVLTGIDRTFEKRRRAGRRGRVNSLAYCEGEVVKAAREMRRALPPERPAEPEPRLDLPAFLSTRADRLESAALRLRTGKCPPSFRAIDAVISQTAEHLRGMALLAAVDGIPDGLDERLAELEGNIADACARSLGRRWKRRVAKEFSREMKPYRGRMSSAHLSDLKRGFVSRKALAAAGVPRISLEAAE